MRQREVTEDEVRGFTLQKPSDPSEENLCHKNSIGWNCSLLNLASFNLVVVRTLRLQEIKMKSFGAVTAVIACLFAVTMASPVPNPDGPIPCPTSWPKIFGIGPVCTPVDPTPTTSPSY
ncbi:hypothetical protein NP233_g7445 [Leucocoprinus birnbaumii]|uniref:Uncharacterized protein n=1 Tax=Leucocoprinus birnbaumii TaxID=56174 RepID=A0AAD5VRV8_9AGAR|nr:hypothetical protein NP233_g7445 [Leucocoprinus birnbaumii]